MKTKKLIQEMEKNFVRVTEKQKKLIMEYWGKDIPDYLQSKTFANKHAKPYKMTRKA